MLENSGLVGYAQEVLKETDQSCFVQTAKQLHVRYNWVQWRRSENLKLIKCCSLWWRWKGGNVRKL